MDVACLHVILDFLVFINLLGKQSCGPASIKTFFNLLSDRYNLGCSDVTTKL